MTSKLWAELSAWWATVTPEFAFLLSLPVLVAVAGLCADAWAARRARNDTRRRQHPA